MTERRVATPVAAVASLLAIVATATAITGFRNENQLDRRREIAFAQPVSFDAPNQHRFGVHHNNNNNNNNVFSQEPSLELAQSTRNNFDQQYQQQQHHIYQQQQQQPPLFQQGPNFHQQTPPNSFPNQQLPPFPNPAQPIVSIGQPHFQAPSTLQHQQTLANFHQNSADFTRLSPLHPPIVAPAPTTALHQTTAPQLGSPNAHFGPPHSQNGFPPTIPTLATNQISNNQFRQTSPPVYQQQPIPNPTNIPLLNQGHQSNHAQITFQQSTASDPLFSNTQSLQIQSLFDQQRREEIERYKELEERQKIIQKHKEYLDRQQVKQQQKVQKQHEEFIAKQQKKQQEIYATAKPEEDILQYTQSRPRTISPHEVEYFKQALKKYEDEHPTTTEATTTTTTTTARSPTTTKKMRIRNKQKSRTELDGLDILGQSNNHKFYKELKNILQADEDSSGDSDNKKEYPQLSKTDLLKQLKLAIAENSDEFGSKNFSSREISLPGGQKIELIRTSDPNLIAGAVPISADSSSLSQIVSNSPNHLKQKAKLSFEELTKGVIPPGADYEVIKQSDNGKLEEVQKLPGGIQNKKKVTFVFLEEQHDGSYKVQGVRANNGPAKGAELDSILKKIKEGEIELPPPSRRPTQSTPAFSLSTDITRLQPPTTEAYSKATSFSDSFRHKSTSPAYSTINFDSQSTLHIDHNGSPHATQEDLLPSSPTPTVPYTKHTESPEKKSYYQTTRGDNRYVTNQSTGQTSSPTTRNPHSLHFSPTTLATRTTALPRETMSLVQSGNFYQQSSTPLRITTARSVPDVASSQLSFSTHDGPGLIDILKENGLFATAKYLKQSGLNTILNETGPYTVFAPTDKAFRTLLIQLGGPDKAEQKFKENPRLLSGLLLHHVIPGAFEISALQDEMTGVSLAGTQLRVNQYDMHDVEWNEIKVTTINGARILQEKQDIRIPQGVAHAVDRVMFPLPVGDIVQTLQSDRERRFTHFLKALFSSGMSDTLSESKVYTVFAPTDQAFASLTSEELRQLTAERGPARELVTRHVAPGTLFSAGMRYYQVRDSMEDGKPITLQKNSGRIKVNSGHVVTHNIPATNGVIHAVDTLL